jgi:hypothetical protein
VITGPSGQTEAGRGGKEPWGGRGTPHPFWIRLRLIGARALILLGDGHQRGRSFHAAVVSVRGSAGRRRTRSAMMLRKISEVPPSMELPFERRKR